MQPEARRAELADFLRTRRARLRPSEVGLAESRRRRTPGLRREEVALLANIGTTWYTRLEQGLPINVSPDVLDAVARALQLTRDERRHLYILADQPANCPPPAAEEIVSDAVLRVVHAIELFPAIVRGRRFDVLAWNRAAAAFFGDFERADANERNLVWRFFVDAAYRARMRDADCVARKVVAQLRAVAARYPDDPSFAELIGDLRERSGEFRRLWNAHDVLENLEGVKVYDHPVVGELQLDHTTFALAGHADVRMTIYTAAPGSASERKLRDLLERDPVAMGV